MSSPLPKYSEYIIIELDPQKSVEDFNDPITAAACRDMQPKKYLASVVMQWTAPVGSLVHMFLCLVSVRGMVPGPDKHSIPEMCLPISPNVHPWGREPLQSDPPLPWPGSNCFHITLAEVNAVTKYEFKDTRERGKYCQPETPRLSTSMSVDADWKERLDSGERDLAAGDPWPHKKIDIGPTPPGHWDLWAEDPPVPSWAIPEARSEVDAESERTSEPAWESASESNSSSESLRTASLEDEDFEDPRPRLPVIKCCVDLETVPIEEIGDPWDFMKELDVLEQLERKSKDRVQEKIKAVANMDAELDGVVKRTRSLLSLTRKSASGNDHSDKAIDIAPLRTNIEEVSVAVDARHDGHELVASTSTNIELRRRLRLLTTRIISRLRVGGKSSQPDQMVEEPQPCASGRGKVPSRVKSPFTRLWRGVVTVF